MRFVDSAISKLGNTRMTSEGYLLAEAFSVRAGIQRYLGAEVGMPERQFVDVYRPPEEVFKRDSVQTFAHAPITVDHPAGGVDSSTWREKAVGEVSTEALRDGERLKLQLIIKDAAAIEQVKSGHRRQLSAGYQCRLENSPGTTADGQTYDLIQRDIKINHLALVERGRAGNCQIGDSAWGVAPIADSDHRNKEKTMTTKTVVLGNKAVQVVADDAQAVQDYMAEITAQLAAVRKADEAKTGEIAALKQQLDEARMTPEKLAKMVADRAIVAAGYKALVGKDADPLQTDAALQRAAVEVKLGDAAKAMSDEAIAGAFRALTASAPKNDPIRNSGGIVHQDTSMCDVDAILTMSGVPFKKSKEA